MSYDHRPIRFPVRESNTGETCHCQKKRQEMNAELPERSERRIVEGKKGGQGGGLPGHRALKGRKFFGRWKEKAGKLSCPSPNAETGGKLRFFILTRHGVSAANRSGDIHGRGEDGTYSQEIIFRRVAGLSCMRTGKIFKVTLEKTGGKYALCRKYDTAYSGCSVRVFVY